MIANTNKQQTLTHWHTHKRKTLINIHQQQKNQKKRPATTKNDVDEERRQTRT